MRAAEGDSYRAKGERSTASAVAAAAAVVVATRRLGNDARGFTHYGVTVSIYVASVPYRVARHDNHD